MGKKIYVGNLNYETKEDDLQTIFAEYGNIVSVKIITDAYSGRSKGFGFIEMESEDEAQKAISELNGTEIGGRTLKVSEALDNRERGGGGGGGYRGGGGGHRNKY